MARGRRAKGMRRDDAHLLHTPPRPHPMPKQGPYRRRTGQCQTTGGLVHRLGTCFLFVRSWYVSYLHND